MHGPVECVHHPERQTAGNRNHVAGAGAPAEAARHGCPGRLDRGTTKDWFSSTEIVIEAMACVIGIYLFLVHMMTAKKPFIPVVIFKDRNFIGGLVLMFVMGAILLASSALISPFDWATSV